LQQVLEKVMMQLPFRGDMDEGKVGVKFVMYLIQNGIVLNYNNMFLEGNLAQQYLPRLTHILISSLAEKKEYGLKDRFVPQLVQFIKQVAAVSNECTNAIQVNF
jgi:hypothetical protein